MFYHPISFRVYEKFLLFCLYTKECATIKFSESAAQSFIGTSRKISPPRWGKKKNQINPFCFCLFSPAVRSLIGQFVGVCSVITHEPPQGELDTHSRWAAMQLLGQQCTELKELRASPTMWQLEHIYTVQ